jgi:hypothetical protein
MPERFKSMKKRLIAQGMSPKAAAAKSAKITNSDLKPGEKAVGSEHRRGRKR